ncbi:MAG: zinc ribbon domain-containing protein [Acetivibrionales bacterium]|jgi:amino acid transporter
MYCSNCNKTFTDEFAFCDNCGAKLEKEQVAENVQPTDPTPDTPQVTPPPVTPPPVTPPPVPPSQATYQYTQAPPAAHSYQAPVAEENKKTSKTVSFGTWMGIHFLNIIPFILSVIYTISVILSTPAALKNANPLGLAILAFSVFYVILLLIWAIGKPKARSLKNYAKATLLMTLIVIILVVILVFALRNMLTDVIEQIQNFEIPFQY